MQTRLRPFSRDNLIKLFEFQVVRHFERSFLHRKWCTHNGPTGGVVTAAAAVAYLFNPTNNINDKMCADVYATVLTAAYCI